MAPYYSRNRQPNGGTSPRLQLGNPQTAEARFSAVNDWAQRNGYRGGFPNFFQAIKKKKGLVYGAILLAKKAADWRNLVPNT